MNEEAINKYKFPFRYQYLVTLAINSYICIIFFFFVFFFWTISKSICITNDHQAECWCKSTLLYLYLEGRSSFHQIIIWIFYINYRLRLGDNIN